MYGWQCAVEVIKCIQHCVLLLQSSPQTVVMLPEVEVDVTMAALLLMLTFLFWRGKGKNLFVMFSPIFSLSLSHFLSFTLFFPILPQQYI